VAACCALIAALPAASADAAAKPRPRLAATSFVAPSETLDPQRTFTLTGRIANRGRRGARPLLTFALKSSRSTRNAYGVATTRLRRIRPGRSRRFSVDASLPPRFDLRPGRRLVARLCVRPRRTSPARCRIARQRVVFLLGSQRLPEPQNMPDPGPAPPSGTNENPPAGGACTPVASPAAPAAEIEPAPSTGTFTAGAQTMDDRLFPTIGNGGYDARHYDLAIEYQPVGQLLSGVATITAVATHDLSELSFDFTGLTASAVTVDGETATFSQAGDKLVVTPADGITSGTSFETVVTYGGIITPYNDPDGSQEGWVVSGDGAFVVNEPIGSMSWFPNNNVPFDKATYDMHITVPATSWVFGNGRLISQETNGPDGTWHWREDSPMASYLTTATNGLFDRDTEEHDGVVHHYGYDANTQTDEGDRATIRRSAEFADWVEATFCVKYPFTTSGGVLDTSSVGYALESQTRPMYAAAPGASTVLHEIAHQWFGDSVSPRTWSDLWLNEGPAQFAEWLWAERADGSDTTTAEQFDAEYARDDFDWSVPPAEPPAASDLFNGDAMYTRGAMVLEALRQIIGEPAFFAMTKAWLTEHSYRAWATSDFIALVKREAPASVSRDRLDEFFEQWLYGDEKPSITPETF
jgi:hypothetical protein